jgi:hypothetical protein
MPPEPGLEIGQTAHFPNESEWAFTPNRQACRAGVRSAEAVFQGEAGGRGVATRTDLVVDGVEVSLSGAGGSELPGVSAPSRESCTRWNAWHGRFNRPCPTRRRNGGRGTARAIRPSRRRAARAARAGPFASATSSKQYKPFSHLGELEQDEGSDALSFTSNICVVRT